MKKEPQQNIHHIIYGDGSHPKEMYTVCIFKGEHQILTKLSWYTPNRVSKDFIRALKIWIAMNEWRAE